MRPSRFLAIVLVVCGLVGATSSALACSLPSDWADRRVGYYRSVTSVYVATAEDFRPANALYPSDRFTVLLKPVETVWGTPPKRPLKLEFYPGACNEWFLWNDNDDLSRVDGNRYFVFFAPEGERSSGLIRVEPAESRTGAEAMVMLGRLQVTGGRPPGPEDGVWPHWPPQSAGDEARREQPFWSRGSPWLWLSGTSILILLIGVIIGRASRSRPKIR